MNVQTIEQGEQGSDSGCPAWTRPVAREILRLERERDEERVLRGAVERELRAARVIIAQLRAKLGE